MFIPTVLVVSAATLPSCAPPIQGYEAAVGCCVDHEVSCPAPPVEDARCWGEQGGNVTAQHCCNTYGLRCTEEEGLCAEDEGVEESLSRAVGCCNSTAACTALQGWYGSGGCPSEGDDEACCAQYNERCRYDCSRAGAEGSNFCCTVKGVCSGGDAEVTGSARTLLAVDVHVPPQAVRDNPRKFRAAFEQTLQAVGGQGTAVGWDGGVFPAPDPRWPGAQLPDPTDYGTLVSGGAVTRVFFTVSDTVDLLHIVETLAAAFSPGAVPTPSGPHLASQLLNGTTGTVIPFLLLPTPHPQLPEEPTPALRPYLPLIVALTSLLVFAAFALAYYVFVVRQQRTAMSEAISLPSVASSSRRSSLEV